MDTLAESEANPVQVATESVPPPPEPPTEAAEGKEPAEAATTPTFEWEEKLKADLEARENLIKKEERLMAIQKRAYELARGSLPHGVFVDTDLTSMFLMDADAQGPSAGSRNPPEGAGVGFDLNKASPIFIQFLAWQRLMQINQQIRIERSILGKANEGAENMADGSSLNGRVTNLIEKASSGTLDIEYHKDRICKNTKRTSHTHIYIATRICWDFSSHIYI